MKIAAGETVEFEQEDGGLVNIYVNRKGLVIRTKSKNATIVSFRDGSYLNVRSVDIPEGNELFNSRGIGSDLGNCFVCGKNAFDNISGFVTSAEAGQRIEDMFKHGARLDFRPSEPSWIQVKIGSCERHVVHLELLNQMVSDGFINKKRIVLAGGPNE